MTDFSQAWLDLRQPYDLGAHNRAVLAALETEVADRATIEVVDVACGTGATLRAIAPRLPQRQSWRFVDNDAGLLARAASLESAAIKNVAVVEIDLARELEAAFSTPFDIVTASALLDLVSLDWLSRFVKNISDRGSLAYAALTYDGRIITEPSDPLDAAIVAAVNEHQRGDKGFGPALGPAAGLEAVALFEARGYAVISGRSDWILNPQDRKIQGELFDGWAAAANEVGGLASWDIEAWLSRRRDCLAAGRSSIRVGHVDFFARPTGAR